MNKTYLESLLAENEAILLSTRRHWFLLFKDIALDCIVILILLVGSGILLMLNPLAAIGFVIAAIPLLDMIRHILDWMNRQFIITNRRVIQVSGVVNKNVTDSSLEKVNDVKLSQSFWGRLFDYGDVEILTASELGTNLFHFIGKPVSFKKMMMDAKNRLSDESGDGEGLQFKNVIKEQTIPDLIAELDELRIRGIVTQEEFQAKKKELLSRM
ncbi:PH domain-containing protein [Leptolinea tardivitalis]|uniref:DUF304 domain-containing protein n=1 Tax=Leptolinea tardivitalis TaxID=229920 RepID=A0A0P6XKB0_9CHLR|nr:PH domain-containing protein [Leptolinea tardivitalis]KPL71919.1 hypothetical protein ADM99_10995 [Leptolinea tardivitalis]GAP20332.1 predicted membrane protein [Leptolinea tardivitalis]